MGFEQNDFGFETGSSDTVRIWQMDSKANIISNTFSTQTCMHLDQRELDQLKPSPYDYTLSPNKEFC